MKGNPVIVNGIFNFFLSWMLINALREKEAEKSELERSSFAFIFFIAPHVEKWLKKSM